MCLVVRLSELTVIKVIKKTEWKIDQSELCVLVIDGVAFILSTYWLMSFKGE